MIESTVKVAQLSNRLVTLGLTLVFAFVAVAPVAGAAPAQGNQKKQPNNPPPKLTVQESPLSREVKLATSFAPVAGRVGPSVVNIYSTTTIKDRAPGMHPFFNDPFFRRYFGDQMEPRERKSEGLGSGVIVSPDGYVLTANHVVEGADAIKVALSTGEKEFKARVIGTDPLTDIAVLKIEAPKPLPAVTIADSDKLEVGDVVLAIGNPFGVGQTLTMGIVSGIGRGGFGITGYENFIQTDAAINPGNSGGALVDAEGRLVGINTAILSRTGGFQGVGFAVPVNMARYVMDRLVKEGKVSRGYLGINIQPLTPDLAKELGLPDESSGVLVGGVVPRGAADKAGLRDGDVIVEVNGKKVSDPRNLQLQIAQTAPGSKITLRVARPEDNGKTTQKTINATLGDLPQEAQMASRSRGGQDQPGASATDGLDGVEVTDLDARVRRQFGIPNNLRGALVTNVAPDSNAAEGGLRPNDVIISINRQPVESADQAVELSEKATGDRILLRVWTPGRGGTGGGTRFLVIDNSKR